MACYRPVTVYVPLEGGPIHFHERKNCRTMEIPCGSCIGCRIRRQEDWAVRIMCEAQMHKRNIFVTYTYNDEHVPDDYSLDYRHIQLLHYRMRQRFGPFRFFVCGEYGEENARPHYHGIYFGFDVLDRVKSNGLYSRNDIYESASLSECWGKGFVSIGEVEYASARYVATYCIKRVKGDLADSHYMRVSPVTGEYVYVKPEFAKMSVQKGIGETWVKKYYKDIYLSGADGIPIAGKVKGTPRYFDKKLKEFHPELFEDTFFKRVGKVAKQAANNTPERLAVREEVAVRRKQFFEESRKC